MKSKPLYNTFMISVPKLTNPKTMHKAAILKKKLPIWIDHHICTPPLPPKQYTIISQMHFKYNI